ncbi:MAG: hypothetical protein JO257_31245 [Deltaproteobacteria bacterium]|nr:hypothetical protein [Deltaproteobacteria bacterium]
MRSLVIVALLVIAAPSSGASPELLGSVLTSSDEAVPAHKPIVPNVDARIISVSEIETHRFSIEIALPVDAREKVTMKWTGAFIRDGNVLPDTEFTLTQVTRVSARAVVNARKLPSETVRLFPP